MSLAESSTNAGVRASKRSLQHVLLEFDALWATADRPPALDEFVHRLHLPSPDERWSLIEELIKIDLEYRWRRKHAIVGDPWTLADYAAELQPGDSFPSCDLIGEEYWVRQLWGDCPNHAEFLDRYPQHRDSLRRQLPELDRELKHFERNVNNFAAEPSNGYVSTAPITNNNGHISRDDTPKSIPPVFDTSPGGSDLGPVPVVPGYKILSVLDHGGMAVVYTARQLSLNRVVALKVIRGGAHASPKELERFRAEVESVASLRHPNIVQVFEAGEWNGMPYCAMELVSGGSLSRKLNGTPLKADAAARLIVKLARALHAAHEAGIVHRDLKPANVLLEPTQQADGLELQTETGSSQLFEPKVADFGLAKRQGDSTLHTATGELLGTPSYMAPEQAAGNQADVGPHTDVYALGVLLYEMLTCRPPFRATTSLETLRQVIRDEPVSLHRFQSAVPRDLETICFKCLEKFPARRYASAADLASDIERFLNGRPILARRAGRMERVTKWSRRNPAWAVAIFLGALALVGTVAGTVFHNRQLQIEIKRTNENAAEAQRQRSQALANFNKTHETLLGMLTRLWQESQLDNDVVQRSLHENLLRSMLRYYDEVPLEPGEVDPDSRLARALVHFHSAHIHYYLEEYEEAESQFHRALPTLEELTTSYPDNAEYRRSWALCCYRLALTASAREEFKPTEEWLHKALTILGPALDGDPKLMSLAGRCRTDLSLAHFNQNDTTQAISQSDQAAALWREVVGAEPGNDEYRLGYCMSLNMLARFRTSVGNHAEADAIVTECAAVTASWTPATNTYYAISARCDLADSHRVLGVTASQHKRFDAAQSHFDQAIQLLDQVLTQKPSYGLAQNTAHGVYWSRARMYEIMGNEHDALLNWDRCIDYGDDTLRNIAWIGRTECRLRLGDYERAIADADELLAKPTLPGDILFDLATIFCRCSQAASEKDVRIAELRTSEHDWAARAVSCLLRSHAGGYFGEQYGRERLLTTPLLDVLRPRADFQKLLADVGVAAEN
jgi:tetratricopeptide (TPR) repeat protein